MGVNINIDSEFDLEVRGGGRRGCSRGRGAEGKGQEARGRGAGDMEKGA